MIAVARRWRPLLKKPVFIGVTGSAGKTSTKELLLGMLSHKGRAIGNDGSYSNIDKIAEALLRLMPTHSFFVTELSGHRPGEMDENLPLVQPSIAIVTIIGDDHSSTEYPRAAIIHEKSKLVAALPPTGTAVLNADDPAVLGMAAVCKGRVVTYGVSPVADLRAEDISSVWPQRLQMTLVKGAQRVNLRTRLCGTHWVPAVLGTVGGGLAAGMTLDECANGLASVEPFDGRMQPVATSDGVTFIRDDFKAPWWTLDSCFEFMRAARATRKIIVIGELSDVGPAKGVAYARAAILAQEIADLTVFIGPWASSALKARKPGQMDALHVFNQVRDAADFLNAIAREGDLVLLKGTNRQDHLQRIILARTDTIACWRDDCRVVSFCNQCDQRMKPSGAPLLLRRQRTASAMPQTGSVPVTHIQPGEQVIVGLGNPDAKFAGTPHNIGYELVDQLAVALGLTWTAHPEAWIARGKLDGQLVCLIKIRLAMNATGAGLKRLSESMGFGSEHCVLVFDDLDLPIGSAKTRQRGGSGGHRGVASILEAFQTDAFRRIKIGVGQAGGNLTRAEYVLTPFDAGSRAGIATALPTATTRLREMLAHPLVAPGVSPRKT
ncbi:aminoacyl-tRNA hydrolase [Rhodoferax sp.]|uniref:aminoacyl-tRNA hydrolase n=1 Tax=Rhodoferax sp. TaxID=50421 RepID=UPI002723904D|nr:aminoacyl-tRNA hydrolase [Rhodoferax sp.]MDO9195024.1 aminoacyl-tRNA hydrolase [Rhodoferax sp.]